MVQQRIFNNATIGMEPNLLSPVRPMLLGKVTQYLLFSDEYLLSIAYFKDSIPQDAKKIICSPYNDILNTPDIRNNLYTVTLSRGPF